MDNSWEDEFFSIIGDHTPDAPRHIRLATVTSVEPLTIDLDGLVFERTRGEVKINASLLKHKEKGLSVKTNISNLSSFKADVDYPTALEVNDRVAVVSFAGGQTLLVLCKVV